MALEESEREERRGEEREGLKRISWGLFTALTFSNCEWISMVRGVRRLRERGEAGERTGERGEGGKAIF